jgi:GT2 family glycosyltransferase
MGELRVSVVIPSWNAAAVLGACLESVERQELPGGHETIVVDDGSTDHTVDVLREHPAVRVLSNERNAGFSVACNRGAAAARGEVLVFLNSDTELLGTNVLERLAEAAEQPGVGLAGPMLVNVDGTLQPSCGAFPSVGNALALMTGLHRLLPDRALARVAPHRWSHDGPRDVDWVVGAVLAIRADLFRNLGGLWPVLYAEETDLAYRVRARDLRVRFEHTARVMHVGRHSLGQRLSDVARAAEVANAELTFLQTHYGRLRRTAIRVILTAGYVARSGLHHLLGRRVRAAMFREMARVMASGRWSRTTSD